MTTVFMKFLETRPADYDRGIRLLTLGRAQELRRRIAEFVRPGDRVLEIGCGTGALTVLCADRGANVAAVDASEGMLEQARRRVQEMAELTRAPAAVTSQGQHLDERVEFHHLDATVIGEHFEPASFDLIVSSLVFSELGEEVQAYVLEACSRLLKPGGKLLIADEVVPEGPLARLLFILVRLPLILLTWLITRTTTRALRGFPRRLARVGFRGEVIESRLCGSLRLFLGRPAGAPEVLSAPQVPRLRHWVTPWTLLKDLYCLLWRNIPPYPRVAVGLYRVGHPDRSGPVLVTGNYDLTVRRLLRALDGRVDAWLLVADSAGINVWCGAGGGHFTAEKVISVIKTSRVADLVEQRRLILPQLCANGVHGATIEEEAGWRVRWGPCYAEDIPAYLERGQRKDDAMRQVRFPLPARLEMAVAMWQFWALVLAIALLIIRRQLVLPALGISLAMFFFMALTWPHWPTHNGLLQGVMLALLSVGLLLGWSALFGHLPPRSLFNWALGLGTIGLFVGADFQGGAPDKRGGEMEHFWKLLPIGLLLLAAFFLVPRWLGW